MYTVNLQYEPWPEAPRRLEDIIFATSTYIKLPEDFSFYLKYNIPPKVALSDLQINEQNILSPKKPNRLDNYNSLPFFGIVRNIT